MVNEIELWKRVESLLDSLAQEQKNELYTCGKRIVPNLTPEDMLQPNDFRDLEHHPHFRYEEGVLAGILSVQMALRAFKMDIEA